MDRPLTPKQQRFVVEYLKDLNATAAAGRAGYQDPAKGRQLVTKSNVAAAIKAGKAKQLDRIEISADQVLREVLLIATSDMGDIFDFSSHKPKLKRANTIPVHARRMISSLQVSKSGPKVKLWSKDAALERLMRHLGLLKDSLDLNLKGPPFKVYMGFDPQEAICPPSKPDPTK